ncbi:MAG: flagellar GTP-binding protein [Planctomycetota bacterium]
MKIHTYRARTIREALVRVREELGPGASVLHTREVNGGPIARWLHGAGVEIAATAGPAPLAEQAARAGVAAPSAAIANRVSKPLAELGAAVNSLAAPRRERAAGATSPYGQLLDAGVGQLLAGRLTKSHAVGAFAAMQAAIRVAGPIAVERGKRRVAALVGPTGVGKTTTLAKLAANARLLDDLRVALVTVDTYRVAAVEQLRTYAQIIDLPMEVVSDAAGMAAAMGRLADFDLVLIDTAGRSPHDAARVDELRTVLAAAGPDETHLVLSVASAAGALRDAVGRFASIRPTAAVLTKLDEAPVCGHAAEAVVDSGLPISYVTDGQSVPEDMRIASAREVAAAFVGEAPA